MDIDDFCVRPARDDSVRPQPEELHVLRRVYSQRSDAPQQAVGPAADGAVLPVHDHPGNNGLCVVELAREARHQRNHHPHPKLLLLLHRPLHPPEDLVGYLVLDRPRGVRSARNEELVFDVDEALGAADEVEIGGVD